MKESHFQRNLSICTEINTLHQLVGGPIPHVQVPAIVTCTRDCPRFRPVFNGCFTQDNLTRYIFACSECVAIGPNYNYTRSSTIADYRTAVSVHAMAYLYSEIEATVYTVSQKKKHVTIYIFYNNLNNTCQTSVTDKFIYQIGSHVRSIEWRHFQ